MITRARTIVEKIWDQHTVDELADGSSLLYIDRVLLHDRSGGIALRSLRDDGREVFDQKLVFGTMDHVVDTRAGRGSTTPVPAGSMFIDAFRTEARLQDITLFDIGDERQGISHVVFPEQGIALPGTTMVCADSHTPTLGAVGALAWGVGVTECEHALATQTLVMRRPATMRVEFTGAPGEHVYAKDLVLALIAAIGAGGATGYAIEFSGPAVELLDVEARLTLCNMATEAGARTGLIAPDATLLTYLKGRPFCPVDDEWEVAAQAWLDLRSDPGAAYDRTVRLDAGGLGPQVTWGTSPQHASRIDAPIPLPGDTSDPVAAQRALDYMALRPGMSLTGLPVDAVFIGSCTNARLSDLRVAADVLRGHKVAAGITALCTPGSTAVRRAAEAEGIDKIFIDAGFQWRESGCGLCFYAGGDRFEPGTRVISSTNRNFENRQGPGVRTHLASPATVAASAIAGCISDPRRG
ncbi:3-isopropylmalate dehydratase large subunit [Mycobacteroides immunogenum]|uniref:(2R,3S)-2-methylisocitrate dehydratase n=1 Tax=Mycobacteroides immunogenum TaxID=83262 RepID=A0A7V8LLT9_9MYCO|nr:3-isopropylmalate dehydratase large subunit [Mycobacteroides immunogenum]AMT71138.1 3-isopropylmalate dehydratase [Mycobacteroides immunogenum]ANO04244.1 3-isopropylmalate dehydratase [Mycobacteroides immunogenum]KIU38088.1 3-isopropylmalate dehydratase [Mycobacteroides immunogenum]KPG05028.1 3-isopropylmalate dehydratase [Mycobacteroides immunogenum]KPG06718.1 3-isopropylmalate dehydratase [Mycobacteroides immunogenum]